MASLRRSSLYAHPIIALLFQKVMIDLFSPYPRQNVLVQLYLVIPRLRLNPTPTPAIISITLTKTMIYISPHIQLWRMAQCQGNTTFIPPAHVQQHGFSFSGASCNDLFHFHTRRREHLLWNPTTNGFKILPDFVDKDICEEFTPLTTRMWYDNTTDDYKVISLLMLYIRDDDADTLEDYIHISHHIHLYSLKTNSWKQIPLTEINFAPSLGVCINGVFYSIAEVGSNTKVILSFDFSSETVSLIHLPPQIAELAHCFVQEYKGLLSALACQNHGFKTDYHLWRVVTYCFWKTKMVNYWCSIVPLQC